MLLSHDLCGAVESSRCRSVLPKPNVRGICINFVVILLAVVLSLVAAIAADRHPQLGLDLDGEL
jgi:hypothetical protein